MDAIDKRLAEFYARQEYDRTGQHDRVDAFRQMQAGNPFDVRLSLANSRMAADLSGGRVDVRPVVVGGGDVAITLVTVQQINYGTTIWYNSSDHSQTYGTPATGSFQWNVNIFPLAALTITEPEDASFTGTQDLTLELLNESAAVVASANFTFGHTITTTWSNPPPPTIFTPTTIRAVEICQFNGGTLSSGAFGPFNAIKVTEVAAGTSTPSSFGFYYTLNLIEQVTAI